jgi:alcohol dehydrogenase
VAGEVLDAIMETAVGFDFRPRTRIVFGRDRVDDVADMVREIGGRRVLLVTDPGLVAAGHAGRVAGVLREAGLDVSVYDRVRENPTTRDVDGCLETARAGDVDLIVALGGGSSLDTAKGCNFLLTNGGRMQDYWGVGKATRDMLPLIAIPTTAGTGSELQSFALIADEETHQKMACGDPRAAARVAVLDPTLAATQPPFVAACSGLDTIAHAVESAVTRKRNEISNLFARESFRLASASLAAVLARPDDLEAQGRMMLAAAFGGMAIENSMLGAAHAMANPLTARHDVVHGHAVGMVLPIVVRFNGADAGARAVYEDLVRAAGLDETSADAVETLAAHLARLFRGAGLPGGLGACGVPRDAVPALASGAAKQWTAGFNPRAVGEDDFRELYEAAFDEPA